MAKISGLLIMNDCAILWVPQVAGTSMSISSAMPKPTLHCKPALLFWGISDEQPLFRLEHAKNGAVLMQNLVVPALLPCSLQGHSLTAKRPGHPQWNAESKRHMPQHMVKRSSCSLFSFSTKCECVIPSCCQAYSLCVVCQGHWQVLAIIGFIPWSPLCFFSAPPFCLVWHGLDLRFWSL